MKTWECDCGLKVEYPERPGNYVLDEDVVTVDARSRLDDMPGHEYKDCMFRFVAFASTHQN